MSRCARCDWQPARDPDALPDREQARGHALDWSHPLCAVCARSLDPAHPQTCEACIALTQGALADIVELWEDLPRQLGHAKAQAYDRDGRGGAEEHQLPGGQVLALLAPGGSGEASRFGVDYDQHGEVRWWLLGRQGPLTATEHRTLVLAAQGREHLVDNEADSQPSVSWSLASWEDDWRHTRGEPAAVVPGGTSAVVRAAVGYLERHTRWAANTHEAFAEYVSDLRALHARLELATGRTRHPVKAGASCFDCGGTLERPLREVVAEAEVFPWWIPGGIGPRRLQDMPDTTRTGMVEDEDHVKCRQCGSSYDGARYLLALAARRQQGIEDLYLDGWVQYRAAAAAADRPLSTIWSWVQRLQVPAVCRLEDHAVLVWYPAVHERGASRRKNAVRGAA